MKNKFLLVALIGIFFAVGILQVSCEQMKDSLEGNCVSVSLSESGNCERKATHCAYDCGGAEGNTYPCSSVCK